MAALLRISLSMSALLRTHTTITVIRNPIRTKKMPTVFSPGIARLKRHTHAQAIQVVICKIAVSMLQSWKNEAAIPNT
jgi:hypothetical protein